MRIQDGDLCADIDHGKEAGDVPRTHADATKAGRAPDELLDRRAMNVNFALKCPRVAFFKAAEPENPGHDRITARGIRRKNFSSRPPGFEYRAQRGVVADLGSDFERTERRRIAARIVADAEL